ncbi:hypothetical protein AB0451_34900 [Streptomyces sp. NPDC052000]|uniref:hypothetical protein n=1 Tax=Streptomyces sp. NPDC052000 TaxID=3155676 RepID=UPI00344BCA68
MSEVSRSQVRRTEVELAQVPEVAELATALTTLFNGLGIPQQRYAARVTMDKSTVSRFLNGRRVATQDFIDRLLAELERHRGNSITDDARMRIRKLRLVALKATDPQAFELEDLRDQIDRSQRSIKRYRRQQEALELLLDQKEAETRDANRQLHELRADWASERMESEASILKLSDHRKKFESEQGELRAEINELKAQLAQLAELRRDAESRCVLLEERLEEAENLLAERIEDRGEGDFPFTPQEIAEKVSRCYKDQEYHKAARLLSLAAAHMPDPDVVALWKLVSRSRRGILDAARLLDDAIRFGSVENAARITEVAIQSDSHAWLDVTQSLAVSIANSKTAGELQELYRRWEGGGPLYGVLRYAVIYWSEDAAVEDVAKFLLLLREHNDTTISVRLLQAWGKRPLDEIVDLAGVCLACGMRKEAETLSVGWYDRTIRTEEKTKVRQWRISAQRLSNEDEVAALFGPTHRWR